ncbi:hypothetical protein D3C79_1103840 [compost metagenome]
MPSTVPQITAEVLIGDTADIKLIILLGIIGTVRSSTSVQMPYRSRYRCHLS